MEIDGGPDVEFAQQTQNFLSWFRALPGATFHKHIQITDLRDSRAGRGISAFPFYFCQQPPPFCRSN